MGESEPRPWGLAAVLVGMIYLAAGILSARLAGAASSQQVRFAWRLSAFVVSGMAFAAHVAWEHFRLRNPSHLVAWHTSAAVAFGAFALAVAANVHDLRSATGYRPRMLVALVAWPLLTSAPAFFTALALAAGLSRARLRKQP